MLISSTRLQVKHSYWPRNVSSLYRFPYVHNKCPNNGLADYWSLTLVRPHWKIGNRPGACRYKRGVAGPTIGPIWRPNSKKAKKTRELADRYTVVLAQRSTYTGNYKALQPTRTMKRLTNTVWAVKTWSCYLNGRVRWCAVVVQARARWQQ